MNIYALYIYATELSFNIKVTEVSKLIVNVLGINTKVVECDDILSSTPQVTEDLQNTYISCFVPSLCFSILSAIY